MYIAIEGIDGSGTTTHVAKLVDRLATRGPVVHVREPSKSPAGLLVREYFEAKHGRLPSWRTMAHLFQADREILMDNVVRPALAEKVQVVSDRCFVSTEIYQGVSAEIEGGDQYNARKLVADMNAHIPRPDLIIVLTLPFEMVLERLRSRMGEDHYESREDFLLRVNDAYNKLYEGAALTKLDATRPIEDVERDVFSAVESRL